MSTRPFECPPDMSNKLSNVLYALECYVYAEVELVPLSFSNSLEESCKLVDETLVIQDIHLLALYTEGLQIFNKFRQQLKKGSLLGNWKLWDCLSRFLLFMQPGQSTLWNFRKRLLLQNHVSYNLELEVNQIALKRDAKASEVWYHRKWLLLQLEHVVCRDLDRELGLCCFLANRFEKSYHVWYYRWWLIDSYRRIFPSDLIAQEYQTTSKQAIRQHVSDHGAYFYRQKLLLYLLTSIPDSCFELLSSEWDWIKSMIELVDHSFESLIHYTRFIYGCCTCWLDDTDSQQQSLMDNIYKTLKLYYTVDDRYIEKVSYAMRSKMKQHRVAKIFQDDNNDLHKRCN